VEAHARRQDHPALDIERAGKVPDEFESWRQSSPSFPRSRAISSPGPHFKPLYGSYPPPSTISNAFSPLGTLAPRGRKSMETNGTTKSALKS
jgi:hypothetical protein